MKSRSGKNKGKRFQNWIAQQISDLLGIPCEKDGDIESRQMGMSGVDIILRGKAAELFPYSIEAKNQETFSLPAWIRQTKLNIKPNTDWLLFITKNRFDKVVVMDAEKFFELYRRLLGDKANFIYPNAALLSSKIKAQLSVSDGTPSITAIIKGIE